MKTLAKLGVAALMLGGSALATTQSANAEVGVSIGIGGPGYYGYSGGYYDGYYDYYRPCSWYYYYDLPAPRRCYDYFYSYWGPSIFFDGDFIFRDRDDYWRWHDRDDYHHWRDHDFHWRAGGHDWGRGGDWNRSGATFNGDRGGNWGRGDWNRGGEHWGGQGRADWSRGGESGEHHADFGHGGGWGGRGWGGDHHH